MCLVLIFSHYFTISHTVVVFHPPTAHYNRNDHNAVLSYRKAVVTDRMVIVTYATMGSHRSNRFRGVNCVITYGVKPGARGPLRQNY